MLSVSGLGPLKVGDDPSAIDPTISIVRSEEVECEGKLITRWSANYDERPLGNDLRAFELGVVGPEGVSAIQVFSPAISTSEGISVGDTRASFLAAYPNAVEGGGKTNLDQYQVVGSPSDLYFHVADGSDSWSAAEADTVRMVMLVPTGLVGVRPTFYPLGYC